MPYLRQQKDLLVRFRSGDRDSLAEVYWAYVAKIERVVRHGCHHVRGSRSAPRADEVADVVQEVFVRAFSDQARLSYDGLRDYGPFLSAIARRLVIDWARKRPGHVLLEEPDLERLGEASLEGVPPWTDERRLGVVDSYLASLPSDLASVHRLRYVERLSQEEAGAVLGLSRQQLRTCENRLRAGLLRELVRAGLWPP
jgi:RNA polymerase sigma factor (sigma-70 family)